MSDIGPATSEVDRSQITGTVSLDVDVTGAWDRCLGYNGSQDFAPGLGIIVYDDTLNLVGLSVAQSLTDADAEGVSAHDVESAKESPGTCVLKFAVPVEPSAGYTIATRKRGEFTISADELDALGWHVDLALR